MDKVLKGNLIFTETPNEFTEIPNGFIVYNENGIVSIHQTLPEKYSSAPLEDWSNKLIIPALIDMHVHAPQFAIRGIGMNLELIDWLNKYAFPAEEKFVDENYAREVYSAFAKSLYDYGSTRSIIFASIHLPATYILMEELEKLNLYAYVGKVNMDRNSPENLIESTVDSIKNTQLYLDYTQQHFSNIKPILTPRFIPSCTDDLLAELGKIAEKQGLPVQSHLSENRSEIEWVKELQPQSKNYADAYSCFGLLGNTSPCIMAHCVHITDNELNLMKKNNVYIAHCPDSNCNLSSGIAPIRHILDKGVSVGLGSDVAGGSQVSIFKAMALAIQLSKIYWTYSPNKEAPLSISEAFYLGTSSGAVFFGDKPGFAQGNQLHALVIDDESLGINKNKTLSERIERVIYSSDDRNIIARYSNNIKI